MIRISISEEIAKACPELHLAAVQCWVTNTLSDEQLWKDIAKEEALILSSCKIEEINKFLPIQATRQAYKRLGKDPNRYRPSAEALRRRILRGLPLYKIDTLVDVINLLSIQSGFSIGGFDVDKIDGDLLLGVGREGELYHGIGRGELNIEDLPVYRDKQGGVGTPTSDEERTKIELHTEKLLMIINGYSGESGLRDAVAYGVGLLRRYASGTDFEIEEITPESRTRISL